VELVPEAEMVVQRGGRTRQGSNPSSTAASGKTSVNVGRDRALLGVFREHQREATGEPDLYRTFSGHFST